MTFTDALASGVHGLRVAMPPSLELVEQDARSATFREVSTATGWWFSFFPGLRLALDPGHVSLHRRDTLHHTRALFEIMFATLRAQHGTRDQPRTADRAWTPLIELEPADIAGGGAISVLHRMSYQPGHEMIMGHTLIPTGGGLFEVRWVCSTLGPTGLREAVITDKHLGERDVGDILQRGIPQAVFDAPEEDARFPDHPLSRARRAKDWHRGRVEITAPPPAPVRTHELAPIDARVTVPPRFLPSGDVELDDGAACLFDRVSFSGTDGVDRLVVRRDREQFRAPVLRRGLTLAATRESKLFLGEDFADVETRVDDCRSSSDSVTIVTEGTPEGGTRNRVAGRWFLRDGRLSGVAIVTTIALPLDELFADIDRVVESWC